MPSSYLTQEGYDRLQKELDYLRTEKRAEVADRLRDAMEDGELIENAELEAAKNEQSFVEGKIKELEILLANAQLIDENAKNDTIQVGSKVKLKEQGEKPEEYVIVGHAEADPRLGRISNESPWVRRCLIIRLVIKLMSMPPAGPLRSISSKLAER